MEMYKISTVQITYS